MLLVIEGDFLLRGIALAVHLVEEALDDLPVHDRLFHDLGAVGGLDVGIENILRHDVDERTDLTEAVAAGLLEMDGVVRMFGEVHGDGETLLRADAAQLLVNFERAAGDAACTGAYHDRNAFARERFLRLPALGVKRKLCASDHFDSSFQMRSTSATAFSGVIFG